MITINVHADVHVHAADADTQSALKEIRRTLHDLLRQGGQMATKADFDTLRNDLKTATDNVAARIGRLEELIRNSGLTGEEENQVLSELASLKASLEQMGQDPNNPVPPVDPPPPV
jgi:uncharacterized coiled-coil DUF342 family protein